MTDERLRVRLRVMGFSSSSPSAPGFEKMLQRLGERFRGAEAQRIDAGALKSAVELGEALGVGARKFFAHCRAVGIQLEQFARFGVFEGNQARRGQRALARVVQVKAD